MNKMILTSVLALSSLLAACTSAVDLDAPRSASISGTSSSMLSTSEYRCDADPAQRLVGQNYKSDLEQEALALSGSRTVRTLRPRQAITMEYNPERINLRLDERDIITSVGCG